MQINFERAELLSALDFVQGVIERKNTVAALSQVLFEVSGERDSVALSATDLEVGVKVVAKAQLIDPPVNYRFTLPGQKIFQVVRESAGDTVELSSMENNWWRIRSGNSEFKMVGVDPQEFPGLPTDGSDERGFVSAPPQELAAMIDHVIHAVDPDEARYTMRGVLLEAIDTPAAPRMVATDGRRLSLFDATNAHGMLNNKTVLPLKGVRQMRAILDKDVDEVRLSVFPDIATLTTGDSYVTTRLFEGEFPDYHAVIPTQFKQCVTVDRDALLAAVRRCSLFPTPNGQVVKIESVNSTLAVSSPSSGVGEAHDVIFVENLNADMEIPLMSFNAHFLLDALNVAPKADKIVLSVVGAADPMVITAPSDPKWISVVMPLRG